MVRGFILAMILLAGSGATAQQLVLFSSGEDTPPLFRVGDGGVELERRQTASLFAGRNGLLAQPVRVVPPAERVYDDRIARLRDLIAEAEAGSMGYDAVQHGARIRPPRAPTTMTVGEIFDWIEATPGQPHAIGRYQFIPKTLEYLVALKEVPQTARFDPALQDMLADQLLEQAGLSEFLGGRMGQVPFMNAIAQVWAGLPTSSGRSYYHGYAGNKAVLSWGYYEAQMARIFGAG